MTSRHDKKPRPVAKVKLDLIEKRKELNKAEKKKSFMKEIIEDNKTSNVMTMSALRSMKEDVVSLSYRISAIRKEISQLELEAFGGVGPGSWAPKKLIENHEGDNQDE